MKDLPILLTLDITGEPYSTLDEKLQQSGCRQFNKHEGRPFDPQARYPYDTVISTPLKRTLDLVVVTPRILGVVEKQHTLQGEGRREWRTYLAYTDILSAAKAEGLEECPEIVGPTLQLKLLKNSNHAEWCYHLLGIAHCSTSGYKCVMTIRKSEKDGAILGLTEETSVVWTNWYPDAQFICIKPRK